MDWVAILGWFLTTGITSVGAFIAGQKKANSDSKLASAQVDKLRSDVTLEWIRELQDQLKDLREDNDIKDDKIEQLEAALGNRKLPDPNRPTTQS